MVWYFLVVKNGDEIVPLAKLNLSRKLTEAERKKIARQLSGSRAFKWGIRFSLKRVSSKYKNINLKGAFLMDEEEMREAGFNPDELSVIIVPGTIA